MTAKTKYCICPACSEVIKKGDMIDVEELMDNRLFVEDVIRTLPPSISLNKLMSLCWRDISYDINDLLKVLVDSGKITVEGDLIRWVKPSNDNICPR